MGAAAIIVAGGKGLRMGGEIRKQYLELGGIPILLRTLDLFCSSPDIDQVVLAAPEDDHLWITKTMLPRLDGGDAVILAPGGVERQSSVCNGLKVLGDDFKGVVAVHDGVRPFVTHDEIRACVASAYAHEATILAIPAFETLKRVSPDGGVIEETLSREGLWLAQTPQAFDADLLRLAHERALSEGVLGTDDASLVERIGYPVKVLEGSRTNIKITTPGDIALAEGFLPGFPLHRIDS